MGVYEVVHVKFVGRRTLTRSALRQPIDRIDTAHHTLSRFLNAPQSIP